MRENYTKGDYRAMKRKLNAIVNKTPYKTMLKTLAGYFSLKGLSKLSGIPYNTLRRIKDDQACVGCRFRYAMLIDRIYRDFNALANNVTAEAKLQNKF